MAKHPAEILDTKPEEERVVIRPYPKVILYYPTWIMAFICAFWAYLANDEPSGALDQLPGRVFVLVFFFNTLTIAFDFTRSTFIAICLAFALLLTFGIMLQQNNIAVMKSLKRVLEALDTGAQPGLFLGFAASLTMIFLGVFIQTRFNYWEIKHNELLHHHGIAGDVERYPSPNLRMSKEITDVFEYVLLFSGRLVLQPASSNRPIVLDNVVRINAMEKRIEKMLQTLQVRLETTGSPIPPPPLPS